MACIHGQADALRMASCFGRFNNVTIKNFSFIPQNGFVKKAEKLKVLK